MQKRRILTAIKEKKGVTSIKFSRDSKDLRKRISILIFIIILVGNIALALYSSYIFYSLTQLKITTNDLEQTRPDNETIIIKGSISIETIVEITDFDLEFSLITDEGLDIVKKSYQKDKIPTNKKIDLKFDFEFSLSDLDLEEFASLNETEYLVFDIFTSLNYGGYIISIELEIKQDIEEFL